MAAEPQNQHQQLQPLSAPQHQPPAAAAADDDALKRNTDCVYFLASPLTCKKGSECEYRHSEYARVNPRDCWFWLNGNCLNPKCSFRHPPLDGLLGTQSATSAGSSLSPSQPAVSPAMQAPYGSSKQAVPCIFFQKGFCLKGDRCAFFHGLNPVNNKVQHASASATATAPIVEPPSLKRAFGGIEKCSQEQKFQQINLSKPAEISPEVKLAVKTETTPPKDEVPVRIDLPATAIFSDELPLSKETSFPVAINGGSTSRSTRVLQSHISDDSSFQICKDADESLRESSPGFDVLVDDGLGDSDYYHNDDQYGRKRGHEGRNLNSMSDYDLSHSADYTAMADVDRERFCDPRGYDPYDRMQGQYAWEQHRASSERKLMGTAHGERRGYTKAESPDQIDESDLRHHISKQRRVNVRSVVSYDYDRDGHVEERTYRGPSRRESRYLPVHESSLSSRLRGRIKLPRRSSPVDNGELCPERETDRGSNWGRSSPGRPQISSHQGRLRNRMKGRVQEDFNSDGRNPRGPWTRRDLMDDKNTDFAGPKSLAELKEGKFSETKEQQVRDQDFFVGTQKNLKLDYNQTEGDLSFEGPKPLSVILKRKRETGGVVLSGNEEDNIQRENKESLIGSSKTVAVPETEISLSSISDKELSSGHLLSNEEEFKLDFKHSSHISIENELETEEEGLTVDETYDERDGDYDYEQGDEGDFELDEGGNADPDGEYLDDEDGDDFAKKIGVMFS